MNSSFENKTNKYTLKRPISKELYDQANKMGIQIYDTSGRRASGVDSATNKVVYKHETAPASTPTTPKTETGTIGAVGEINYKNLPQIGTNNVNGTNSWNSTNTGTGTKTQKTTDTTSTNHISQWIDTSKFDHLLYKQPKKPANTPPEREGSRIKNRVTQVIKDKWKDLNASHLFDDIDDDTVEKNIPLAKELVEKNKKTGYLGSDPDKTYPYMLDGMTMYLASGDKGNAKAAKKSHDAAYLKYENTNQTRLPNGIQQQISKSLHKNTQNDYVENKYSKANSTQFSSADDKTEFGKIINAVLYSGNQVEPQVVKYSYDKDMAEKHMGSGFNSVYESITNPKQPGYWDKEADVDKSNWMAYKKDTTIEQPQPEENKAPVFYSQLDDRWADVPYSGGSGIGATGCGITSMAMIVSTLTDNDVLPPELAQYSKSIGTAQKGTDISFFKKAANKYGLKATDSYWVYKYYADKVKDDLKNGSMYIMNVKPGSIWDDGHIIVISEYQETDSGNYFVAYDPNFDNAKTYYKNNVKVDETTEGKIYIPEEVMKSDWNYMIGISKE